MLRALPLHRIVTFLPIFSLTPLDTKLQCVDTRGQLRMNLVLIILILLVLFGGGGGYYYGGPMMGGGIGGVLLIILIIWLLMGRR